MSKKISLMLSLAMLVGAGSAYAAPSTTTDVVAQVDRTVSAPASARAHAPVPASADATTYAQLERRSQTAQQFQGGSTVVIAMSGTAFVVALVLLVLLI